MTWEKKHNLKVMLQKQLQRGKWKKWENVWLVEIQSCQIRNCEKKKLFFFFFFFFFAFVLNLFKLFIILIENCVWHMLCEQYLPWCSWWPLVDLIFNTISPLWNFHYSVLWNNSIINVWIQLIYAMHSKHQMQ